MILLPSIGLQYGVVSAMDLKKWATNSVARARIFDGFVKYLFIHELIFHPLDSHQATCCQTFDSLYSTRAKSDGDSVHFDVKKNTVWPWFILCSFLQIGFRSNAYMICIDIYCSVNLQYYCSGNFNLRCYYMNYAGIFPDYFFNSAGFSEIKFARAQDHAHIMEVYLPLYG